MESVSKIRIEKIVEVIAEPSNAEYREAMIKFSMISNYQLLKENYGSLTALVEKDADIKALWMNGLLVQALENMHISFASQLVKCGGQASQTQWDQALINSFASEKIDASIILLLITLGAKANQMQLNQACTRGVRQLDMGVVEELIHRGAVVDVEEAKRPAHALSKKGI